MSKHTYTVHVVFEAEDDQAAWEIAKRLPVHTPYVYVTDADDWAEHVPEEGLCSVCGKTVNRERTGTGERMHVNCAQFNDPYPIVDVPGHHWDGN